MNWRSLVVSNTTSPFLQDLGHVYISCVWSVMLHASGTRPLAKPTLQCLQRNDTAMIRQICIIKPEDVATVRSKDPLQSLCSSILASFREKEGFADFDMWSVLMVQSEQNLIYKLVGGGRLAFSYKM